MAYAIRTAAAAGWGVVVPYAWLAVVLLLQLSWPDFGTLGLGEFATVFRLWNR